ncbi:MAG: hypothetical protein P9L94_13440 [Candidatus Hinthialibacter antarcticus]|nr:hypothetical protein [Candidatus Hinthialibacter antarcticus]
MKKTAFSLFILTIISLLSINTFSAERPNLTPTPTPNYFAQNDINSLASPTPTPVYIASGVNPTPSCTALSECDSDSDGYSDDEDPNPYVCNPCRKANNWELDVDSEINPSSVTFQPNTTHLFQLYWDYNGDTPRCNFPSSCASITWIVSGGTSGVDYAILSSSYDWAEITFYNGGNYTVTATHSGWSGCDPIYGNCSTPYTSAPGGSDSVSVTIPTPTPTPTNTPSPTPTPDCCQKARDDLNWVETYSSTTSLCLTGPPTDFECAAGYLASGWATDLAHQVYPHDDAKRNAFQHAAWHLYMVETGGVAHDSAKLIGDAWEVEELNQCGETYKDLYNNSIGRALEYETGTIQTRVTNAVENGDLRLTPGC